MLRFSRRFIGLHSKADSFVRSNLRFAASASKDSTEEAAKESLQSKNKLPKNTLSKQFIDSYWNNLRESIMTESQHYKSMHSSEESKEAMKSVLYGTLKSLQGKASVVVPAVMVRRLCIIYASGDNERKASFLDMMANELGIDYSVASIAANLYIKSQDSPKLIHSAELNLRKALTPLYEKVFIQVSAQPDGTKFLVDLRADLLDAIASNPENTKLKSMDECLKRLLATWFTVGLLELRHITWRTSTDTLEKIKNYEAVHPIPNWEYLKSRVDHPKRRCYAFFHPTMPREPLVFVHVALLDKLADNIHSILEGAVKSVDNDAAITHAIFYSISATQKGLRNIDLGNFLIKRVVMTLKEEFPSLKTFATLSPIPGFRQWLNHQFKLIADGKMEQSKVFLNHEIDQISKLSNSQNTCQGFSDLMNRMTPENAHLIRDIVLRLCARYLYVEKKDNHAVDPVANFHLQNGASMGRLNFLANISPNGVKQSATMMINYEYNLNNIEQNNRAYWEEGIIHASSDIVELAQKGISKL